MPSLLPDGPIDTLGAFDAIQSTPDAVKAAGYAPIGDLTPGGRGVVLLASGADALVARAAQAIVAPLSPVPVLVHSAHRVPSFVSDEWHVVVVTSASSRESLDALRSAQEHRAMLSAVGSGELLERAAELDASVMRLIHDVPAPRFGFSPMLVATLRLLDRIGVIAEPLGSAGIAADIAAAVGQLEARRAELDGAGLAADIARRIGRTLPLIYSAGGIGAIAARRWKTQCNDNAKVAAFDASLPDLAHHELSGWGQHGDMTRQVFSLVTLHHDHEHPVEHARFPAVIELMDEVVHARHVVEADGEGVLAQLLDLVYVGDLTSFHLAQQNEIDPGPTAVDVQLERLAREA